MAETLGYVVLGIKENGEIHDHLGCEWFYTARESAEADLDWHEENPDNGRTYPMVKYVVARVTELEEK
jgi:hypothetical protein